MREERAFAEACLVQPHPEGGHTNVTGAQDKDAGWRWSAGLQRSAGEAGKVVWSAKLAKLCGVQSCVACKAVWRVARWFGHLGKWLRSVDWSRGKNCRTARRWRVISAVLLQLGEAGKAE